MLSNLKAHALSGNSPLTELNKHLQHTVLAVVTWWPPHRCLPEELGQGPHLLGNLPTVTLCRQGCGGVHGECKRNEKESQLVPLSLKPILPVSLGH